jgi:hypothetical protein
VNDELFVVRIVEERFREIDLGVKRTADSQLFNDGLTEENYRSVTEEVDGTLDVNGERDRLEEDDELRGRPNCISDEIQSLGYCP